AVLLQLLLTLRGGHGVFHLLGEVLGNGGLLTLLSQSQGGSDVIRVRLLDRRLLSRLFCFNRKHIGFFRRFIGGWRFRLVQRVVVVRLAQIVILFLIELAFSDNRKLAAFGTGFGMGVEVGTRVLVVEGLGSPVV